MTDTPPFPPSPDAGKPLESWKEIAAYLKRDIRTVKRWEEREALPVHRHMHLSRSSVYAYATELDAWWAARTPRAETGGSLLTPRIRWLAYAAAIVWALCSPSDRYSGAAEGSAARAPAITVRQVWAGGDVDLHGSVSPDGRSLTFVDRESGDLAVRSFPDGGTRRLTHIGPGSQATGFAVTSVVSPDNRRVAYTWVRFPELYELHVVGIDGAGDRLLHSDPGTAYVEPRSWSPDGRSILATFLTSGLEARIVAVSAADGSARVLKTLDWRRPSTLSFSPDGKYIAYDILAKEGAAARDIFLLGADGRGETPLVQHASDDALLGWVADGQGVLFASDRTGTTDCWFLRIVNGQPQGQPERVKRDIGRVVPLGFTQGGAFYYGLNTGMADVYVAEMDLATGTLLARPKPVAEHFVGANRSPAWSADGRRLAYTSRRGISAAPASSTLVTRTLEDDTSSELPLAAFTRVQLWDRCGQGDGLVAAGFEKEQDRGIYLIDGRSGEATLLVRGNLQGPVNFPACSPDGKTLYFLRLPLDPPRQRIVRRDLAAASETVLWEAALSGGMWGLAVSPDGRHLAFTAKGTEGLSLKIVPTEGGAARDLVRFEPNDTLAGGVAWTPDGRSVLFGKAAVAPAKATVELWAVAADGGQPRKTGLAMERLADVRVHPDGRRVAFGAGDASAEVWVMEGYRAGSFTMGDR